MVTGGILKIQVVFRMRQVTTKPHCLGHLHVVLEQYGFCNNIFASGHTGTIALENPDIQNWGLS
jgi:hypothetical protein